MTAISIIFHLFLTQSTEKKLSVQPSHLLRTTENVMLPIYAYLVNMYSNCINFVYVYAQVLNASSSPIMNIGNFSNILCVFQIKKKKPKTQNKKNLDYFYKAQRMVKENQDNSGQPGIHIS